MNLIDGLDVVKKDNTSKDVQFFVGQKALIEKGEEVLILHIPHVGLDFPGGKITEDEYDLTESLKREVREETALEIRVGEPFYSWWFPIPLTSVKKEGNLFIVAYRCRYISGEVELSHEHDGYEWVDKTSYTKFAGTHPHYKALEKYFQLK